MTHKGIPWPAVRWLYRNVRRNYFVVDVPDSPHLIVTEPIDEIREIFGKSHFTNSWELSYSYRGEDLNMRRPEYNISDPERPWYQLHVRGFELDNGNLKLMPHYEYEPTEYPKLHLDEVNFSVSEGMYLLKRILDDYDISYREVSP